MMLIDYSKTAVTTPDMYHGQDLPKQYAELLIESNSK